MVGCLQDCTSPRTCSAQDGIHSLPPVVLPEENLDSTPRAFSGLGVSTGVRIDEVDAVVDSAMPVTLRAKFMVRTPAVTDNCSAGFDPVMY